MPKAKNNTHKAVNNAKNYLLVVGETYCNGFNKRCEQFLLDKHCCYDCGLFKNNIGYDY